MKRLKNILLLLVVLLNINYAIGANNDIMIDAYTQALMENPKDVESLLGRAREYYGRNDLYSSIEDLNSAVKCVDPKDKELSREIYMLRANVNDALERYDLALDDVNMVLDGYSDVYVLTLRADLSLRLNMLDQAKRDYQTLLAVSNKNYAAMYGLAKIAVKEDNNGIAKDYVDRAVELYPKNIDVYLNRADIMSQIGELSKAAHDLIFAMTISYDNPRTARELMQMSRSNYSVVVAALNDAISYSENGVELYYVRAFIKMCNTDYKGAYEDMIVVTTKIEDKYSDGVNGDLAYILFKLGRFEEAMKFADMAIRLNPNKINYFIQKAKIEMELGDYAAAEKDIKVAMMIDSYNSEALLVSSEIAMEEDEYDEAVRWLNEAVMNNPEVVENLILRAVLKGNFLNDDSGADSDLNMALMMDDNGLDSYRGFVLAFLGRNEEAVAWIKKMLVDAEDLREVNYRAAVLYSIVGDVDSAMLCMETALANGYGDYYNLMINDYGFLNTMLLRNLPAYKDLVNKYLGDK